MIPKTEALTFAAEGKGKATIETVPLESVNGVFDRLRKATVEGRVVFGIREEASAEASRRAA
jgi:propanol-preferring alcohol dehydrogenase